MNRKALKNIFHIVLFSFSLVSFLSCPAAHELYFDQHENCSRTIAFVERVPCKVYKEQGSLFVPTAQICPNNSSPAQAYCAPAAGLQRQNAFRFKQLSSVMLLL